MKTSLVLLVLGSVLTGMCRWLPAQTSYSWAAYPTRCSGVAVYTQPNMTVDVTGTGFANYGPQCAVSACASTSGQRYFSPKYVTAPNASAPDWQYNGLALGVDWTNTSSTVTVFINFTTAVCGPLTFSIYDINSGTWGGFNPVWRDRVTISGTNFIGAPIYPSTITGCANNTVGGANNNIISAGLNTGCTNSTHTITFNSTSIKTLTIVYSSLGIDATYGTDPDPEYIIISNITSTGCALPEVIENCSLVCQDNQNEIRWTNHNGATSFSVQKSSDGNEFVPVAEVGIHPSGNYSWKDDQPARKNEWYRIHAADGKGDGVYSNVLFTTGDCSPGTDFNLFPSPGNGLVNFVLPESIAGEYAMEVNDLTGRLLHRKTGFTEGAQNLQQADLSFLPQGWYLVTLRAGSDSWHSRLKIN